MISVLIIAHQPLATALLGCCRHVYRGLPVQAAALDIIPDEDPDQALREARALASRINDGSGQVVLTDLYGATPSRIAMQMAVPGRASRWPRIADACAGRAWASAARRRISS